MADEPTGSARTADHTRSQLSTKHADLRRTGDQALRAELVQAYRPLAVAVARRYSSRASRESLDDLTQVAMVGLIGAVDRFDPERGVEFSTFAWTTITGELKRHFRDQSWSLRVPRSLKERFRAASRATDDLTVELGRSPTIAEIAQRAGTPEEDVLQAIEVAGAYVPVSIDAAGPDGTSPSLPQDDHGFSAVDNYETLGPLVARLPDRQRDILRLRFVEELTQTQIAHRLGISQMHVCRLLADSLATLRQWMEPLPR